MPYGNCMNFLLVATAMELAVSTKAQHTQYSKD